jgi:hypothetical protein
LAADGIVWAVPVKVTVPALTAKIAVLPIVEVPPMLSAPPDPRVISGWTKPELPLVIVKLVPTTTEPVPLATMPS